MYILFEELRDYYQFYINILANYEDRNYIQKILEEERVDFGEELGNGAIVYQPYKNEVNGLSRTLTLVKLTAIASENVEVVI